MQFIDRMNEHQMCNVSFDIFLSYSRTVAVIWFYCLASYWWICYTLFSIFSDGENTFYTSLLACISFQDDAHSIASESYTRPDTEVRVCCLFIFCPKACISHGRVKSDWRPPLCKAYELVRLHVLPAVVISSDLFAFIVWVALWNLTNKFHFAKCSVEFYAFFVHRNYPWLQKLFGLLCVAFACLVVMSFKYFSPFTYGTPALSADDISQRKWISSWKFLVNHK